MVTVTDVRAPVSSHCVFQTCCVVLRFKYRTVANPPIPSSASTVLSFNLHHYVYRRLNILTFTTSLKDKVYIGQHSIITMDPIFIIIGIGALGGFARSILGFLAQSDTDGESFDFAKSLKSVLRAAIGGAILAYSLNFTDYKTIFFAAYAADVAATNLWNTASTALTNLNTNTPPK